MAKKDSELMRKIKDLGAINKKLATIHKAAQSKQDEFDLTLMDIEESFGCSDDTLKELGRIVTKYFGMTITTELFEEEIGHIISIEGVSGYVESMKSKLPNAEELAALAEILYGSKSEDTEKKDALNVSETDTDSTNNNTSESISLSAKDAVDATD